MFAWAEKPQTAEQSTEKVFSHPVFTYFASAADSPTLQPALVETQSEYNRRAYEVARDLYPTLYAGVSSAVVGANREVWGFQGVVESPMVQRMVVYDSGGDHKMLVGGWWTGADFNTTRHTSGSSNNGQGMQLIEMFHTYTQLAEDEACDGGLVFEIAGGASGEDAEARVQLRRGEVLVLPSYLLRRALPLGAGARCEVVEGVFVGTDARHRYRDAAVQVAAARATAAQPHRSHQLRTVLQGNSDYMPLLTQAFNAHVLPTLTRGPGFELTEVPAALMEQLREHYAEHREGGATNETVAGVAMHGTPMLIAPQVDKADGGALLAAVESALRPVLEAWVGRPLTLQRCHGVREYRREGYLKRHIDWPLSHVVAVIINLAQEGLGAPWPLTIEDHAGKEHEVVMAPGQMVLYESSRLVHGRPFPLDGERYTNLFVHMKPVDDWEATAIGDERWRPSPERWRTPSLEVERLPADARWQQQHGKWE